MHGHQQSGIQPHRREFGTSIIGFLASLERAHLDTRFNLRRHAALLQTGEQFLRIVDVVEYAHLQDKIPL